MSKLDEIDKGVDTAIKAGNWIDRNPRAFAGVVLAIALALGVIAFKVIVNDRNRQIEDLTRERDEYKYYIMPRLREIAPTVQDTKQALDTLSQDVNKLKSHE